MIITAITKIVIFASEYFKPSSIKDILKNRKNNYKNLSQNLFWIIKKIRSFISSSQI